ncbi:unnamed protein product [Lymnaea stagnalis]|uniref:RB1-inducible coiled-coil protein 1 n=1 Tax=Lymnaea stagnalis TaxID=6523 RepID=A0AAV2HW56_LYMST
MLYVFQMDVGQMLTFDISLLMDSVSRLQEEIVRATGIPIDKQILLVSGGHSLKPDQKVMTYGAGADTNPVFLFSKLAIESQEAPLVRSVTVSKDLLSSLKERISEAINLPTNFDTVTKRTKIACQIRDSANKILSFCSNEFKEQHLQYQGWGTVVANLEEIAQAMQKTEIKFSKAVAAFLPQRENHFTMLENFSDTLDLLERIPLIKSLKALELQELSSSSRSSDIGTLNYMNSSSQVSKTLLDWITNQGQGQSLDALQHQSYDELLLFNSEMFEQCDRQVQELLASVTNDPHQMKELVGIGRRLSELEKRLNDAKKIAKEQSDMAQGFLNHQARLNSTHDAVSVLPDLCKSHKQQLVQMLERQQRMEALQNNFRKSKQEMSTNIHQRLGWVMHIETQISKLDSDLIFHMKTLRILECNLELLNQVKAAPQVYANMVVEAARRKHFSLKFSQWAESLVEDSSQLYQLETERRKKFARKLGEHFLLDTLFKGFDDMPPSFATRPPQPFDLLLPDITLEDIVLLKNAVPELEESLSLPLDMGTFPPMLWIKGHISSSLPIPHSQSSQTEWAHQEVEAVNQPTVITATEAPPFKFTLPELHESHMTDFLPAVTIVTDAVKDAITSNVQTTDLTSKHNTSAGVSQNTSASVSHNTSVSVSHNTSASFSHDLPTALSSANATDSSLAEAPLKVQSKVNSDSASPLSSNEFATADFYFEDSMPSPMADSPLGKKEKKKGENSKTDLELITSLHAELAEKTLLIQDLERKLQEKEVQLSESGRTASQRELSSDGSSTLIGTVDVSDHSSLAELAVHVSLAKTENTGTGHVADGTDPNIKTAAVDGDTSDNVFAKSELAKLRELLVDMEVKLVEVENQKDEEVKAKVRAITDLENQIKLVCEELSIAKNSIQGMEEGQVGLEKALCDTHARCQHLEAEVKNGDEALIGVRNKLKEFRDKLKMDIPFLKETLTELRGAVLDNKSELDVSMAAAMASVEREVSLFASTVLAAACSDFTKEKEALSQEIQQLKASLHLANSESEEKLVHLTLVKDELTNEIGRMQQEFAEKYQEQKMNFETSVRDLETKHAIETELEVDKCRADMKESQEECERNKETLRRRCEELEKRLSDTERTAEKMKDEMVKCHNEQIQEFELKFAAEKAAMARELAVELENKISGHNRYVTELQANLEAVKKHLTEDKTNALDSLKEHLTAEHETAMSEIRQQVEEQKGNITALLEQKQLDYAQKLTTIKTQFDMERESLQGEVNKYKNRERSDIATQLDYDLLSEIMTHSETQTGLELLAEVISLTSSASYGSEEMIAHKLQSSCTEEKQGNDPNEVSKFLQTTDELNLQLAKAQEKIEKLSDEVSILRQEKQELADQFSSDGEKRPLLKLSMSQSQIFGAEHPRYQDLMQTSNTTSFTVMTRDVSVEETQHEQGATNSESIKDKTIAQLEKKLMEMSVTKEKEVTNDKVSIRGCDKGDLVLLCLDERHDQYVVFTIGTNLHFLHSESLECLGLQTGTDVAGRKSWILAEVVDKEYCLAKKPNNRFRVPEGTCFYRVRCKPWKSDVDFTRQKRETGRQIIKIPKMDHGLGARPKKEKK